MHLSIPSIARAEPRAAPERSKQLAMLTRANTDDILGALGCSDVRHGRRALELMCRGAARGLAHKVIAYDDQVAIGGLRAGGAWAMRQFAVRLEVSGAEHVPPNGPLLIVANHPGLSDTTALFAAIERPDLRVVATDRLFLRALTFTSRYLLYIDQSASSRFGAVRAATRHLRGGGAVLTFPAGRIEPDPAVLDGAEQSLDSWSNSIEALARLAPGITIVPAMVGGVLSPAALKHPLTALRRSAQDRQWLAALLQIQLRSLQGVTVRVAFGRALNNCAGQPIGALIKAEARRLLGVVGS
jgi:hypothetical protein